MAAVLRRLAHFSFFLATAAVRCSRHSFIVNYVKDYL